MKKTYEVMVAGKWQVVGFGEVQPSGWLRFQTVEGWTGFTAPGLWRVRG